MTENEAIQVFKELLDVPYEMLVKYDSVTTEEQKNALVKIRVAVDMAIQALSEIQQYRAIGTIEELQALKEKSEPKKPLFSTIHGDSAYHCSSCKKFVGFYDTRIYEYCHNCGQKIDFGKEE